MSLSLTVLDWVVAVLTLGFSIAFGLYISKKKHAGTGSENFFLAGRKLTWPVIGASLFATNIGSQHLVGLPGDAYLYGVSAGTIEVAGVFALGFAAAFLFPYYIKNQIYTIPQFLEIRYNNTARLLFSCFTLFISILGKMALELFAAALVLQCLLGWPVMYTVAIVGLFCAAITIIGGFTAVAYSDTIQTCIVIFGCAIMLFIGLEKVGGWTALTQRAHEQMSIAKPYTDPNYPFWGIIAAGLYAGIFYWGCDQTQVQRVFGARNMNHARWGTMFAVLIKLFPVFIFAVPGVIASVLYPGREAKTTFVTLLNELLPTGIRGLVLAALIASTIASLEAVMNSISTLFVRDLTLQIKPDMSEKKQVLLGRLSIVAATILGVGAAYLVYRTPGGVFKYFQTLGAYLFMPITPAILFGILSRRVTVKGAWYSVLIGTLMASICVADELIGVEKGKQIFPWLHTTFTENYSYRGAWAFIIVTALLFTFSAFTEKTPIEKLNKTTINWKEYRPDKFQGITDWRLQFVGLVILTGLIYVWLW